MARLDCVGSGLNHTNPPYSSILSLVHWPLLNLLVQELG
jgi:hypothetical protein